MRFPARTEGEDDRSSSYFPGWRRHPRAVEFIGSGTGMMTTSQSERDPTDLPRKVTFVCSSGGHMLVLQRLRPWWEARECLWVTFRKTDTESLLRDERAIWAFHPTQRNIPNALRNLRLAWKVLRRERPDVVVSSGAGVAFPFFLVAKALRIRTVFVEVYDRIDRPSLTGRLCYPISDLFVLQVDEQLRAYPRGRVIGALV